MAIDSPLMAMPRKTLQLRIAARWELASRHPSYFLQWFCFTLDQHDQRQPIKPFPWHKPHIQAMTGLWLDNPLLIVAKSRQMVETWLFCALHLWLFLFRRGQLIMLQSKREEDAIGNETAGDGLVGRSLFMLHHIPYRRQLLGKIDETATKIENRAQNNTLWAIPQGPDIIRQRTCSALFSDECGVQPDFDDAYTAAIPTILGGGRFTGLFTANPSFAQQLFEDTLGDGDN